MILQRVTTIFSGLLIKTADTTLYNIFSFIQYTVPYYWGLPAYFRSYLSGALDCVIAGGSVGDGSADSSTCRITTGDSFLQQFRFDPIDVNVAL